MLRKTAKLTLEQAATKRIIKPEISLVFTGNNEIRSLNKKYRQIDRATDVLSFPLYEDWEEIQEELPETVLLGDIVISTEKAVEQAENLGQTLKEELLFLFVHGLLHLLGYDHKEKEEEEQMLALQRKIINELQVKA